MDGWHWATVVVLSLAFVGETWAAYCVQRQHLIDYFNEPPKYEDRSYIVARAFAQLPWVRLWGRRLSDDQAFHEELASPFAPRWKWWAQPHTGYLVRGIGRLSLAAMAIVLIAFDQDLPWS